MLKVVLSTAPTVIQGSLCITSLPLNKTRSDKTFSPFSGIHGEPGIKTSKVGKTSHYLCFICRSYEDCCAFFQVASADDVVKMMIDLMTNTNSQSHLPLKSGP